MKPSPAIFTEHRVESVAALSEKALIAQIREWLGDVCPAGVAGVGDDAAVLPTRTQVRLVTTDSIVFGRHFLITDSGRLVGQKLMERNLSDIAAMGGVPDEMVVALFLSSNIRIDWLREFYFGMVGSARESGVRIVGGDITQLASDGEFAANATLIGHANCYLTRLGGRVGDSIFVTGALGGSASNRHLTFRARLKEGQWLSSERGVHAMMDISDGLFKDLPDMLGEGMSAVVNVAAIPIHPDAVAQAKETGRTALQHAMSDGEDYELLVAVDENENPEFVQRWEKQFPQLPITRIGSLVRATSAQLSGLLIDSITEKSLVGEGYDSLKKS